MIERSIDVQFEKLMNRLLNQIKSDQAREIQFRLGQKTIAKIKDEWIEVDQESLGFSEWEDLKDLCLQNSDKLLLETKGFVRGVLKTSDQYWSYSFTEHKDCLKVFFSQIPSMQLISNIQSAVFWDALKNPSGLFIVCGQRGQGKSSFLKDIINEKRKNSPQLVAVHSQNSILSMLSNDSLIHLNEDVSFWDSHHPIYDGIDQFIVDFNSIKNWDKWIKLCEEGRSVYISMSAGSIENCLEQIISQTLENSLITKRLINVLNGLSYQKIMGVKEGALHEFLILTDSLKSTLLNQGFSKLMKEIESSEDLKKYYQSLNQSIIQALVRRRIDVKTAFQMSQKPDELDQQLKRMGL